MNTEPIVSVQSLTRRFGAKTALDSVDLTIEKGTVLGLVGQNAAGKTTLIKHLLGLLTPDEGIVRVFGRDPTVNPVEVLGQTGYLAEEDALAPWMTVAQLQSFGRAFYRGWDQGYAERLRVDFGLSAKSKLRTLSKGQRARAGLMLALSYRPALLLLDEPSSGLDPIVRREILTAIVRSIAGEGRTVLFSSHLLGEVERMSDRIAMIQDGRIVMNSSVDDILSSHIYLTLRFKTGLQAPPTLEGLVAAEGCGRDWRLLFRGARPSLELESRLKGADVLDRRMATLDEIFVGYARADKQKENGEEVRN